ncbi:MAG: radical SAM protein [Oscillospiraceae bacterium]|nr:radical SAM protein [Oscillospiraceae bacterium]
MKEIRTAGICTLGCRVNQYESEVFAEYLKSRGVEILDFSKPCDMYIINTCSVTAESDRKSRQMLRRAARTGAPVIVTGCHSQLEPQTISAIEGVSYICGNADKAKLVKYAVDQILSGNIPSEPIILNRSLDNAEYENISIAGFKRTRAYIKIQDGCNGKCSYCIIPKARGLSRSREPSDIISEIKRIAYTGCNEIVLTGIETSDYSYGLGKLLSELDKVD